MDSTQNMTTFDDLLILYAELNAAEVRAEQRKLKAGTLQRIVPGVLTACAEKEWPAIIALHRTRLLAALFPGALIGYRTAFKGGIPVDGVMHLSLCHQKIYEAHWLKAANHVINTMKACNAFEKSLMQYQLLGP